MKKTLTFLLSLVLLVGVALAGCSSNSSAPEETTTETTETESTEPVKITVGLNGSGVPIWEYVKEKAAKEGIEIEMVEFADYVRPNMALADGDITINAFQTVSYFNAFIEEHNLDLVPIGTTIIAPMGLYSDKYTSVDEIPDGAKIAVPEEATNMGRALLLLQEAGFLKLVDGFDGNGDQSVIVENPKNIEIVPITSAQTPRVLPDVDASVINNGVAIEAGFIPVEDSIFIEDATATPYINIIAARAEDKDDPTLQKLVEIYQQDDVAEHIKEVFKNSLVPVFVPLSELEK
ncbi:MetQ/NlpA family ABC transporter substrate-binding protein [Bacillus sp. Marseille-P3661]|uniref:MetQ/NlpA family ABC transporter substrate-binding protein n=1 Tax=Bacillus sp. Marseille-P3661 TaxID=1936234 RepID=UPI000C847F02|nr:MetQ/NlpA family ABC transporter substrate-binding protein [Bacillus sp. Marseille-P3661]